MADCSLGNILRFRMTLRITAVEDRAARERFIRLPFALYRDDPHWVAPLLSER